MFEDWLPLGFKDTYLLDQSPRNCFVLGAEWATFLLKLQLPQDDNQKVHAVQVDMLMKAAKECDRTVTYQWINDDWVLLSIEAKEK